MSGLAVPSMLYAYVFETICTVCMQLSLVRMQHVISGALIEGKNIIEIQRTNIDCI